MYTGTQANATASLLALAYSASDPVPGGCNLEYDMEVDLNLRLSYNLYETVLEFAPANLGYPRGSVPPACDQDKGPESRWRLEYDVYQTFLDEGDLGVDSLLSALRCLSSASGCEAFGSKLSVVACAVLGGYAVVLACAVFVRSSLPYLLLNTVRRAALKDYTRVYNAAPFQTNDYVLASVWASLALAGTLFQARRGWGLPTFPPCPYEEWLYNAERRSTNVLDPSHHRPSARGRACLALASACAAMRRPGKRRDDDGEGGGGGGGGRR
uniref:Transmembrane 7 superfamily member 3-like n=1 Tax=Petromyzon marinus TaxID=7757 RepID=A0AAJ7UCI0_PETMA|nr:transmembrane 7 superfamily member 3-like [Petromyzon marinus]